MSTVTEEAVLGALRNVKDPDLGRDIVTLGFVKEVKICGGQVGFTIELTTPACPVREQLKSEAARFVAAIRGVETVNVKMTSQVRPTMAERASALIPAVKNVVPVASGKGGVGKSTVAVNLALALARTGARVGLMDADVYGPSVPTIMGIAEPIMARGGRFVPADQYGIKVISTASMIPPGRAAILRGPMLHKVIEQFLGQTEWGELDYLIVDLPPGTGDIHLSLCQMIPLTGAAIVSTPQDVALKVAEKAIFMFRQLRTPVLGLIENMSYFLCEHGSRYEIFGHGGARRYCIEQSIPFLGEIPLATQIRSTSDEGRPIVMSDPESEHSQAFLRVAKNLAAQISVQAMGGAAEDGQGLKRLEQPSRREVVLEWKDGHVSRYDPFALRLACACATCVDENTGRKILREESVPKDVWAQSISPVGRYGLQFVWSDGHATGIYTFERLRAMCPCCGQKK
jgi:ATP-binding protein involved in chromosome partitioning